MSYSSYGGAAYRNGRQVIERSDCVLGPNGGVEGSPGGYPGYAPPAREATDAEVLGAHPAGDEREDAGARTS